jgi:Rps23 Pro-64 3,4-dihydroxylase Tpa1-like proline 4-hydroxylase
MLTDRSSLAEVIVARLTSEEATLAEQFHSSGRVHTFVLDHVLPVDIAQNICAAFPDPAQMMLRKSLRERKLVSAQMDRHAPLLEEAVYAFQQAEVVDALGRLCGIEGLMPDEHLYAGGISVMQPGHFLNPHIDNSHDKDRQSYRVLNLLYYVTPDWQPEYGGNLELWDAGPRRAPARTVDSRFNRLVVMATTRTSWHSVSPVTHDGSRRCISNYYFAAHPFDDGSGEPSDYFHPTSFRGFADEPWKDVVLRADALARAGVRKVRPGGVVKPRHLYQRP